MTAQAPLQIAVLGGSGFIGTQLVRTLVASGHRVRIGDIAPSKTFPDLRVDCDVREVFLARLINSSLISKGPNVSNLRSFTRSILFHLSEEVMTAV